MRRIFWDAMLFIYLLEDNGAWTERVEALLLESQRRGDQLLTSYLALGEVLAGSGAFPEANKGLTIRQTLAELGFEFLAFNDNAVEPFGRLRAVQKVKIADSIHLACAAAADCDLFLTGDKALMKLHVPGIKFIADFWTNVL